MRLSGIDGPPSHDARTARSLKQQSSRGSKNSTGGTAGELGRCGGELDWCGRRGGTRQDGNSSSGRRSADRCAWDAAVVATAASRNSIAGGDTSAEDDAGDWVAGILTSSQLGEVGACNACLVGQVDDDGQVAEVGDAVGSSGRVKVDISFYY